MSDSFKLATAILLFFIASNVFAADIVPNEIQQPGTQPGEVSNFESVDKCDNCHGNYNPSVEPAFNWRGSMMAHATRDPIFWATLAIAEQDFGGSGDLCLRCHTPSGWYGGRSLPTDGSALTTADADGVECDFCHKLTSPDDSEHIGVQNAPFLANDENTPATGYFGSGMTSVWAGSEKMGPYADAEARHQFLQSQFTRSVDFCGTCHDVSNPAVGDLAHNNGSQQTADAVIASGIPGAGVETKAAFNNFPYQYGIVERTFSEYKAGLLSQTLVADYPNLPAELQGGALEAAYQSALTAGTGGNYADGSPRYFSCQTCHMRPVNGPGCNKKGAPSRSDLPLHDMTGGNYWMADAISYLDGQGKLRVGDGLTADQLAALRDGQVRAKKQLNEAAALVVSGKTLRVINQTGHKLISGYPEGRRMWLNMRWYDAAGNLLREDGKYDEMTVTIDGTATNVKSLLDLYDTNTRVYEAHYGMTQEWAAQLLDLGYPEIQPLHYDRLTGTVDLTLGELAAQTAGSTAETFHFVLNNTIMKDNRIPPYGMSYDEARKRNALPAPADQFGNPGAGGAYRHWDEVSLNPPSDATYAEIDLLYQPTSWEYIQFLYLANDRQNPFLGQEGSNMLDAWLNTEMAEPYTMASTVWGSAPTPATPLMHTSRILSYLVGRKGAETQTSTFSAGDSIKIKAQVIDENGANLEGAQVFLEVTDNNGSVVTNLQGFSDQSGMAELNWKTSRKQTSSGNYTATVVNLLKSNYEFDELAPSGQPQINLEIL